MKIRVEITKKDMQALENIPIGSTLIAIGCDTQGRYLLLESNKPELEPNSIYTKEKIREKMIHLISKKLCAPEERVTPETDFFKDLNIDFLDTVELIMAVEDEFEIEIPDDDMNYVKTVRQAIEYVCKRLL
jgi:acyl carrier protein